MEHLDFLTNIKRLIDRFGDKRYPKEVCEEIWNSCRDLSPYWFSRLVTHFLSTKKTAPLAVEFTQMASIERKRTTAPPVESEHETVSMFTPQQTSFLFALTARIARRSIPSQNEFVEIFTPTLERIIKHRDRESAHNLFKEISQSYSIPYLNNDDDGPEAA